MLHKQLIRLCNSPLPKIFPFNFSLSRVALRSCFTDTYASLSYGTDGALSHVNSFLGPTTAALIHLSKRHVAVSGKCVKLFFSDLAIVTFLNLFCIPTFIISLRDFLIVDFFLFYPSLQKLSIQIVLLHCINFVILNWNKLLRLNFDFNMSLPYHVHRILSVVVKPLFVCNGI